MSKQAGAPCPNCGKTPCSEYAMRDKAPQWKCNYCEAGGLLFGDFTGRPRVADAAAPTKKHWRDQPQGPNA